MDVRPSRKYQYLCSIGTAFGAFVSGNAIGWSSSAEMIFSQEYVIKLTPHDQHLIIGVLKIGAAVAQLSLGLTIDYVGLRTIMMLTSIPHFLGWIILAFADSKAEFCLGRFIIGFCVGAICLSAPVYIGDISDQYIRGTMCELFSFAWSLGILTAYCMGDFHSIFLLSLPVAAGPAVMYIILMYLPNSPVDLYRKNHTEEAEISLMYFRGKDYDISKELEEIEKFTKDVKGQFWINLVKPTSLKAAFVLIVMFCIQQLTGTYIIIMHAYKVCKMIQFFENPNHGAIIFGIVQLVFSAVSTAVVDKVGRKPLWIVSLTVMGICHISVARYFTLLNSDIAISSLVPLISIITTLAAFSVGAGPLPFVMLAEIVPIQVKGCINSIAMVFN
ncbi:hypothetical protein FQA39_LY15435 [Lamprigera yunnana]|nr:hypothetical protein FQA39_LY15435 [Lamprigera yunnana]